MNNIHTSFPDNALNNDEILLVAVTSPLIAQAPIPASDHHCLRVHNDDKENSEKQLSNGNDDEQPCRIDPTYNIHDNSLVKHKDKSDLWDHVKHLQQDHEKSNLYTYVCVVDRCGTLIKLLKPNNKPYCTTTKIFDHVRKKHDS